MASSADEFIQSVFGETAEDREKLFNTILFQPAQRVSDCIEPVRVQQNDLPHEPVVSSSYSVVTDKACDNDAPRAGIKSELDTYYRLLKHLDDKDTNTNQDANLPDVRLECRDHSVTRNCTYSIDDLQFQLNPDRASVFFEPNVKALMKKILGNDNAKLHPSKDNIEYRDTMMLVNQIIAALNVKCSAGKACSFYSHYFPRLRLYGPVVMPNSVVTLIKHVTHLCTSIDAFNNYLDLMTSVLSPYIRKSKQQIAAVHPNYMSSGTAQGAGGDQQAGTSETVSKEEDSMIVCICCLFTKQQLNAFQLDPTHLTNIIDGGGGLTTATPSGLSLLGKIDQNFKYKLISSCKPPKPKKKKSKYTTTTASQLSKAEKLWKSGTTGDVLHLGESYVDVNYIGDALNINPRVVIDLVDVDLSAFQIKKSALDGLYRVIVK